MSKLIDFKTGKEIIEKPLSVEDEFIQDLLFVMLSATTEEAIKEALFSKYNITIKNNNNDKS